MKKVILISFSTLFSLLIITSQSIAVPIKYDLLFTADTGTTFDIGFIIDTDEDAASKTEDTSGIYTGTFNYTDTSSDDFFYHRISRVGSTQINVENWLTHPDDDYINDSFFGRNNFSGDFINLNSDQDKVTSTDSTGAGFDIVLYGVTNFYTSNWIDQVTSVRITDYSETPTFNFSVPTTISRGFELTPTASTSPVPEPATMLLFGTGLAGLIGSRLRQKK